MSQDLPPNQPPTPETPTNPQPNKNQLLGFFKGLTIKILRFTINILQGVLENLETTPETPLISTPGEITATGDRILETTGETTTPKKVPVSATGRFLVKVGNTLQNFQAWWNNVALPKIRTKLPESVNQKLPNWGLTGAIVSIVILIIALPTNFLNQQPTPTEIGSVITPTPTPITPKPETPTPEISKPETPTPEISKPATPTPTTPTPTTPTPTTPAKPKIPTPTIATPSELKAPKQPKPVKISPPPTEKLTPEQILIASIKEKLSDISNQYADGLIQSIKANFAGSSLLVKIGDDWYKLNENRQTQLVEEIQNRAKDLDFSKLLITDTENQILARSPVIGEKMIILKRRQITNG